VTGAARYGAVDVARERVDRAVTPRNDRVVGRSLGGEHVLAMPQPKTRTEEERLEWEQAEAQVNRAAARMAARDVLKAGCRGPGCDRGHRKHVARVLEALYALGLVEDPVVPQVPRKPKYGAIRQGGGST